MASVSWSDNALDNIEKLDSLIRERILLKVTWMQQNFSDIVPEPRHREISKNPLE